MAQDVLESLILRIRSNEGILRKDEQTTIAKAVYPVLAALGWRPEDDDFVPEHGIGTTRVDIALKSKGTPAVFVEVKRAGEPLHNHQQQLLQYAFGEGVPLACLTDGIRWWFYLPTAKGSWEQRRFFTVDLAEIPPVEAAKHLMQLLGRAQVTDETAIQFARELHAGREKQRKLEETIPNAWRELCSEADESLLAMFAEKVEGMCGYRPDYEDLAQYLAKSANHVVVAVRASPLAAAAKPLPAATPEQTQRASGDYTFKRPKSFAFGIERFPVHRFKDVLLGLAEQLLKRHGPEKLANLSLAGRGGKPYISHDASEMNEPREIGTSGLWIETCLSANAVIKRCEQILAALGEDMKQFSVDVS